MSPYNLILSKYLLTLLLEMLPEYIWSYTCVTFVFEFKKKKNSPRVIEIFFGLAVTHVANDKNILSSVNILP